MTTLDDHKVSPPPDKNDDLKEKGFFNRPRKGGKSFWDWLNLIGLLAIPLVVGAATIGLGLLQLHLADVQHQHDQQIVLDQQEATILQTYIDNIQDLLLNHNLLRGKPGDDVTILAQARTLLALRTLDPDRKGILLQFLYASDLITVGKVILSLDKADLSGVRISNKPSGSINLAVQNYMSGADLQGANLNNADIPDINFTKGNLSLALLYSANLSLDDLSQAGLSGSLLWGANLAGANLANANLAGASLLHANLTGVTLDGADLKGAFLSDANLSSAQSLTQQQLDQVLDCRGAILPKGLICHQQLP